MDLPHRLTVMRTIKLPRGTWRYDPDRQLGEEGGFGTVYAGLGEGDQEVAIKRLHLTAAEAAHRELRIADELTGSEIPHVIPIFDDGQDAESDAYYVVMAQAESSLQDVIWASEIGGEVEAETIIADIVRGLQDVPDIVHRDLKPSNILFHGGKWKVADFGIASFVEEATSANTLKKELTPQYAAPEQWQDERATNATDVYALGCIGYALLSGSPPFEGNSREELREQHLHQLPPPLKGGSARLRTLLSMMLRKESRTRPSLDRVLQQLAQLDKDQMTQGGAKNLVKAAAAVAEERSRSEASEQAEMAIQKKRKREAVAALGILKELSNELCQRISNDAPEAEESFHEGGVVSFRETVTTIKLGHAELTIATYQGAISADKFTQSGWDVLAGAWIEVKPTTGSYKRSASLWYTDMGQGHDYRWYEVCYMNIAGSDGQHLHEPFALPPGKDADYAAASCFHSYQFAAKPKPIDDEDFDAFCDRWKELFAQAMMNRLEHPSFLPLD